VSIQTTAEAIGQDRKQQLVELLERTRRRTLKLVEPLSERALNAVHDPLMSPIAWDLGHIANFEEQWLVQRVFEQQPLQAELGSVYDPFSAPRPERGRLPYLRSDQCLGYMEAVRERALESLAGADLFDRSNRLLRDGFIYELIARHEQQHSETILQTLQIMTSEEYAPACRPLPAGGEPRDGMVLIEQGRFELGASEHWFAYDNERPGHVRELGPFWIDRQPVTNGQMRQFVENGGYERAEWWSEAGWRWRRQEGVTLPRYWQRDRDGFFVRSFAQLEPLDSRKPICHVSWYEADAYARYAGKRLPTEAEWEKAASWDPADRRRKRRYPWGDDRPQEMQANLDQLGFGSAPVGSYPDGKSAYGVEQMVGDVWEWTASGFDAYPGFRAFPYREYSEPFFGGPFKVLRGGAWATQPDAVSTTFRNWDHPDRRQIFAGFRCARDAAPEELGGTGA
jgi:iron(II)-dependent oxidoreductase